MKRIIGLLLACMLVLGCTACGGNDSNNDSNSANNDTTANDNNTPSDTTTPDDTTTPADDTATPADDTTTPADDNASAKSEGVMIYAEYAAADLDTKVVVETYVQAKQSWWDNKGTFYTQDQDGAYFLYNMPCSQEDYDKLIPGTKIQVTGYKSEWSGEVEITDAEFKIIEGDSYVAAAEDVTSLLGKDELIDKQNMFVAFNGMTVEAADDSGAAFLYSWDGSGQEGDDLYFKVSVNGATYTFTVESYLCDSSTDVYKAVQGLNVGDTVDMEGFLYWYEGVNPHITSVTVK